MKVTEEMRYAIYKFLEIDCNFSKDKFAELTGVSRTPIYNMFRKGKNLRTITDKTWKKYKPLVQEYLTSALEENQRREKTDTFSKTILDALNNMDREDQKICAEFILFNDERKKIQGLLCAVIFCKAMDDLQIPCLTLDNEGSYLKANINWLNWFNKSENHIINISIGKKTNQIKDYFEGLKAKTFRIDDYDADSFVFLSIKKNDSLIQTLALEKTLETS